MTTAKILGRAWIYDTGDPAAVSVWEHELEPMEAMRRSGADWALSYFNDLPDSDLREMFNLPEKGNFQVLFSGSMWGERSGYDEPEWDEGFDLDEGFKFAPIPPDASVVDEQ